MTNFRSADVRTMVRVEAGRRLLGDENEWPVGLHGDDELIEWIDAALSVVQDAERTSLKRNFTRISNLEDQVAALKQSTWHTSPGILVSLTVFSH